MKIIKDDNIAEYLKLDIPIVIDFSAEWCVPCRAMAGKLDGLEKKYDGKVLFLFCDVEENTEIVVCYGVKNVPTLLFLKDGELVDRLSGSVGVELIEEKINSIL